MADQPEPIKTQDAGADGTPKELSEKELKKKQKQAEKAAKAAKAKEKQAKLEQQKAAKKETTEGAEAQKDKEKDKKKLRLRSEFVNTTPKGEKKDMTGDMLEAYDPPQVEAAWYEWWEKQGYFKADNQTTKEKFVIVIPPPNVTGSLHLGHALTNSVQDAIVRWHRMHGREVLWVPGLDHAGIATQNVVEKKIAKERNQTRHDLGRENFVQEVWKWKQEYGDRILFQLRRLGSSLDWSREAFTMNEMLSKAVTEAFVRLFDDKKIYRATRLVNWCTQLNTAIADIEVDHEELEGQTMRKVPGHGDKEYPFGQLVFFSYPIEGSDDKITVATTRVETMLADTAIAVNPTDERYKKFHGKFAIHPFNGRKIPIVLDAELVKDITLGSGAVKVTPAHDPDDYDCGVRNKLPMIDLFTDDGHINENGAPFAGMKRFDARVAVTEALKQKGLLVEVKSHKMKIPLCSRSKDVIEPRLKPQWWVDCKSMAQASIKAVETGELKIFPEAHVDTWYRWLGNIRDWCISRQLWWGHRVPAYHINIKGKPRLDESNAANWAVGRTEDEARSRAAKQFGVPEDQIELKQDEDVLDTWFSSGLFPFSVFGWPDNTTDLQAFYPTSLLETGHDILFFWVARMVMMGLHLTGKLPFKEVLLHAMVRDAHGRKMTKSLGNVIDPIDVIEGITLEDLHKKLEQSNLKDEEIEKAKKGQKEDFPNGISECGTDATRFALCAYTCQGRDINLDINRVVSYRNFCNKLWNATRFALSEKVLGKDFKPTPSQKLSGKENLIDKWILSRLNSAIRTSNEGFKEYDFGKITTSIYNFWLYELCDVYLEAIKPVVYGAEGTPEDKKAALDTLYTCLDNGLRLLHPFMPFVTEELWQRLNRRAGDTTPSICISSYPTIDGEWDNPTVENEIKSVQEVIKAARAIRLDYKLLAKTKTSMVVNAHNEALKTLYEKYRIPTLSLTTSEDIKYVVNEKPQPGCAVSIVNENCEVYLLIANVVNLDAELTKLGKQQQKLEGDIATWEKKMAAKDYEKIKAEVKQQNANKLASLKQELETTLKAIESFSSLKK